MMKIYMLIYFHLYKKFSTKSETGGLCLLKLFFRSFLFLIMMMGENVNIDAKYNLNSEGIHCYVHAK